MARLKLFFVAVAVAALGGWYLSRRADVAVSRIQQEADERLRNVPAAVGTVLVQDSLAAIASVKAVAQANLLGQAVDSEGRPTLETLESVRAALERVQGPEAERPVLIVVAAQGVAGRYLVGQSNRIDHDLTAFSALEATTAMPRAGIAVLDGDAYRYAVAQFDDGKVAGAKGLLAIGFPIDDAFAQRLALAAGGLDIAVVANGQIQGSTLPPAERSALQQIAASAKGSLTFGALSGSRFLITDLVPPLETYLRLPVFVSGQRYRGRALPAIPEVSPEVKVVAAVKTIENYGVIADEQRQLLTGISGIVLLCLVLLIFTSNPARGLGRVVSAAERIVQGDREVRAPTTKMGPLVRRTAVAINALASTAEQSAESSRPVSPDLAMQLGIKPRNTGSMAPLIPSPAHPASHSDDGETVRAPLGIVPAAMPQATPYGVSTASRPSNSDLEPMVLPQKPKPTSAPPFAAPLLADEGAYNPEATVVVSTPQALIRNTLPPPSFPQNPPSPPSASLTASVATPAPVALPSPFAGGTEDAHFQQVYRDFVATKERCGEPADGLTYEKFAAKLRKNQEQLIAKYACRTVRFQVYVKDGKTALKAQPIK